jgi:hypothetical protein
VFGEGESGSIAACRCRRPCVFSQFGRDHDKRRLPSFARAESVTLFEMKTENNMVYIIDAQEDAPE